ncbi:acyl-CoA dehydrogenase family protein [Kribbella sp. NBC_00359]|uniref:acyl-CoA dehydrogenase family protein n=1 Tax=Kribbella sp. NBC_00359 TaxID=2975966 RepID=UPI002E246100
MDFDRTGDQRLLAENALEFARTRLNGSFPQRLAERRFGREEWGLCGEFGLLGASVPQEYGGLGLDALSTALAVEQFARGCRDTGLVFSACAHLLACVMPLVEHADEDTRRRVLPGLVEGRTIGANAITEAEAGSDVYALSTTAIRDGQGYVLSGVKTFVTNAPVADLFLVYAKTDPADGYLGISAFLVDRETPGLSVGEPLINGGLVTSPVASVQFNDCRVAESARLGAEGDGRLIFNASMRWERTCLFAAYLGVMDRQLEEVIHHVRERRQFRKPLARQQSVAHRVADMKMRLEGARLLLYRSCWILDKGFHSDLDVSLAKLAVSEAAIQSGLDAIHLHGAMGVIEDSGVDRLLRDAIPSAIFSATSEIHRDLIARRLGL